MKNKVNQLAEAISQTLSSSDIAAAKQLAKISSVIVSNRLERGMNQKQFAEFVGASQGMISKWESGEYNFTVETLANICEKLNLDFDVNLSSRWTVSKGGKSGFIKLPDWRSANDNADDNTKKSSRFEVA